MISDFYPNNERNTAYGIYYLAIPVGAALGYGIGALVGSAVGWRASFYVCGLPGVIVSVLVLRITNPVRGINDGGDSEKSLIVDIGDSNDGESESDVGSGPVSEWDGNKNQLLFAKDTSGVKSPSSSSTPSSASSAGYGIMSEVSVACSEIMEILSNKHFMFATLGYSASNFALGGLAEWYPTFLIRYTSCSIDFAGLLVGGVTVIGGIFGTVLGSKVADYYKPRVKSSYFLIPALFTIPSALCLLLAINYTESLELEAFLLLVGEICVWTNNAPVAAVAIAVIPPHLRARSSGVLIFAQHILGDIISPPIIGVISDSTNSLRTGIQITWIAVLVSGLWWWMGYFLLEPLDLSQDDGGAHGKTGSRSGELHKVGDTSSTEDGTAPTSEGNRNGRVILDPGIDTKHVGTYRSLLCGPDALIVGSDGEIVRRDGKTGAEVYSVPDCVSNEGEGRTELPY